MSLLQSIVTAHDSSGTRVLDIRTLPEDVKCEIMMAALAVAAHYGNGDIEAPEGGEPAAAFTALTEATNRIDGFMHWIPARPRPQETSQ